MRGVTAAVLGGAAATVLRSLPAAAGVPVDAGVAGALATAFAAGYVVPPGRPPSN